MDKTIIIKYGRNDSESITVNDIYKQIELYAFNHNIDGLNGLNDCKTGVFNNILSDVADNFFKPLKILKVTNCINNKYDINKLNIIYNIYTDLCIEYDKMLSVYGLGCFIGIDLSDQNYTALYYSDELKRWTAEKAKNIEILDARRIEARATDSKQPILNIAYANYRHGWNGTIKANEIKSTVKTLADIRQNLSLPDVQTAQDQRHDLL